MKKINFNRELQYDPDWEELPTKRKVKIRFCEEDTERPTKTPIEPYRPDDDGEYLGEHHGFLYQLFGGGRVRRSKRKS